MDTLFALSLGFAGLILATHAGHGQTAPDGAPRAQVPEELANRYQETRRSMGLAGPQQVVDLFAAGPSGSGTQTATLPDGRMCLIAAGQVWETVTDPPAGDPA